MPLYVNPATPSYAINDSFIQANCPGPGITDAKGFQAAALFSTQLTD
jgi:hypothetical protein